MKQSFLGYYNPTKEQLPELWDECLFVFDTNVLLSLYRYSSETRNQLIEIFNEISERIWIPYQVGFEYQENRLEVIFEQEKINKKIEKGFNNLLKSVDEFKEHPWVDLEYLKKTITESKENIIKKLDKDRETFYNDDEYASSFNNDKIRDFLTILFEGKVGKPFPDEKMEDLYKECDDRYENKIPPGFKDTDKDKNHPTRKYGDFILWKQIINKAKIDKKPIIFVTEDKKEDWWLSPKGKTIGPRPELIKEFYDYTDVQFYMYKTDRFTEFAKKQFFKKDVDPDIIKEIRDVMFRDSFKNHLKDFDSNILIPYEEIGTLPSDYFSKNAWELSSIKEEFNKLDQKISLLLIEGNDIPDYIEEYLQNMEYKIHDLKMKFWKSSDKTRASLSEKYKSLELRDKRYNKISSKSMKEHLHNQMDAIKKDIIESEELLNHINVSLEDLERLNDKINRIKLFINNKDDFIEML